MPHATGDMKMTIRQRSPQQPIEAPSTDPQPDRIRIKNRRKRYLDLHPEYFQTAEIELADPLLYDRLVRRFQSAAEREKEGRERGFTGSMETDLVRSEAKLEALQHPDPNSPMVYKRAQDGSIVGVEADEEFRPRTKEDAWAMWTDVMEQRFLRGDDRDFDYAVVDRNEEFDDRAEEDRSQLEDYVGREDAQFVGEGLPTGETGVQDF
ncbi:hypothetical protein M409DRAFT_29879 [Zasmidium cellare ATCC 36951]|uniref:CCD97-like C-terminal domain-containing protein n=1 Tax=Zasmidium cellare ATCC 36951 TaxID=1080233 RepID=A0A6A6C1P3_ZASCE|nr:uncharacterized protein M409DRAFT_29879 [Zasmidium cellare ATCC 36951]KAF2159719.1 hypothetical protein M409DRAFT_29879 [Zasmidium cellare ATCC 36951]